MIDNRKIDLECAIKHFSHLDSYGNRIEARERYIAQQANRIVYTINTLLEFDGLLSILDIGAFPFFMSTLIKELIDCDVVGIDGPQNVWPGETSGCQEELRVVRNTATNKVYEIPVIRLNVERDDLPFEEKTFDVVICTEILEHLIMSPTHMLSEAHRVLKDNGTIIISTPNALYWNRISSLLRGTNIDAAYSAYGVYARHNRNYTMEELRDLLIGCNFAITNSESRTFKKLICKQSSQIKPAKAKRQVNVFSVLRKLLLSRLAKIEHYKDKTLIIVARKIGVETEYFPSRLYQHREEILLTKGKAFY